MAVKCEVMCRDGFEGRNDARSEWEIFQEVQLTLRGASCKFYGTRMRTREGHGAWVRSANCPMKRETQETR